MSLPSLNSLRTFESAARLKSFALAAEELFVSPSAVSHQIKLLEQRLGATLFVRLDRRIELSEAGARYYPQVKLGMSILLNASSYLIDKNDESNNVIKISVVPFLATRWLLPKLAEFKQCHPHLQLKIQTSTQASNFAKDDLDLVIRRGKGPWEGMVARKLCGERLSAVCSPGKFSSINKVLDLLKQPLLFNVEVKSEWREWFESQHFDYKEPAVTYEFQNTSQILDACLAGAGIALIDPVMIRQHLSQGTLVNLFSNSVESLRSYFVVYPERQQQTHKIEKFEQWILKTMQDDPLMADRLPI